MLIVNSENFTSEVLSSSTPVLLDFFAEWCGPCKALTPSLEALALEYEGRVKFVKMDIDEISNTELVTSFGVRSVPTLMIIQNGVAKVGSVGMLPKNKIKDLIDNNI